MNETMRKYLSVALTTAGGALLTYASDALATGGIPATAAAWKALGTGALVAVIASLVHLYQAPPGKIAVSAQRGFVRLGALATVLFMVGGGVLGYALVDCTPAARQTVVTDVTQFGPQVCVAVQAVLGADVPGIAVYCQLSEDAVVAILTAEGLPALDGGAGAVETAAKIASTKAYATALARKAAHR